MPYLATNVQIHWAGHPGDPYFCMNASAGAKGCLWPGTRKKRKKIKLKAQTPASKPVGSSNHSDRPFVVIVLSYPINWLFKHWEVDVSCRLTVIPITSIAHICFICIAPVTPQTRRAQLNYEQYICHLNLTNGCNPGNQRNVLGKARWPLRWGRVVHIDMENLRRTEISRWKRNRFCSVALFYCYW